MGNKPKHGESRSPEYRAWQMARLRCTDPENAAWPDYGGRGITICDRWLNDVAAFIADMGRKPSPKHELDRIDNAKGYEPGNCRWATRTANSRNRRSNRMITLEGETRSLAEWCEIKGSSRDTIRKRLESGWTPEAAFATPVRAKAPKGQTNPDKTPCADCGALAYGERCQPCENRRRPRGDDGRVLADMEKKS
jgi:hypothetical protein